MGCHPGCPRLRGCECCCEEEEKRSTE
jgi:hypothetical protein